MKTYTRRLHTWLRACTLTDEQALKLGHHLTKYHRRECNVLLSLHPDKEFGYWFTTAVYECDETKQRFAKLLEAFAAVYLKISIRCVSRHGYIIGAIPIDPGVLFNSHKPLSVAKLMRFIPIMSRNELGIGLARARGMQENAYILDDSPWQPLVGSNRVQTGAIREGDYNGDQMSFNTTHLSKNAQVGMPPGQTLLIPYDPNAKKEAVEIVDTDNSFVRDYHCQWVDKDKLSSGMVITDQRKCLDTVVVEGKYTNIHGKEMHLPLEECETLRVALAVELVDKMFAGGFRRGEIPAVAATGGGKSFYEGAHVKQADIDVELTVIRQEGELLIGEVTLSQSNAQELGLDNAGLAEFTIHPNFNQDDTHRPVFGKPIEPGFFSAESIRDLQPFEVSARPRDQMVVDPLSVKRVDGNKTPSKE